MPFPLKRDASTRRRTPFALITAVIGLLGSALVVPLLLPSASAVSAHRVALGSAVSTSDAQQSALPATLARQEVTSISGQTATAFAVVEPAQGRFDLSAADQLVALARSNGLEVRAATLVGDDDIPDWVASLSGDQARQALEQHVKTVVGRYQGKVVAWNAVTDAVDDSGALRDNIWKQRIGATYVADVFRWAHEADPAAQLFYSDYDAESNAARPAKVAGVQALVKSLQQGGVPIDGVGLAAHRDAGTQAQIEATMAAYASGGLQVAITEMAPSSDGRFAAACAATPQCTSLTWWGVASDATAQAVRAAVAMPAAATTTTAPAFPPPATVTAPAAATPTNSVTKVPGPGVRSTAASNAPPSTVPAGPSTAVSAGPSTYGPPSIADRQRTATAPPADASPTTSTTLADQVLGESIERQEVAAPLLPAPTTQAKDHKYDMAHVLVAGAIMVVLALLLMWFGLYRLRLP